MTFEEFQSKLQQRYPAIEFEFSTEYDEDCEETFYYALSPTLCISYSDGYVIHCKELP